MGLISSVLGKITQSVDNLNFRTWKDKNVIARKITESNQPNTTKQVENKTKFGLIVNLSRHLLPLSRIGFKAYADSMTENNVFQKENMSTLDLVNGNALNDAKKVIVSKGSLKAPEKFNAVYNPTTAVLKLSWSNEYDGINSFSNDYINFVIISKQFDSFMVNPQYASRVENFLNFHLSTPIDHKKYAILAFFSTANGLKSSETVAIDISLDNDKGPVSKEQ